MINSCPFQVLEQPCEESVAWITRQMDNLGLRVMVTFDVRLARIDHTDCPCPHHGTDQCDCELSVMLVFKSGFKPATLLLHGYDGKTWLSLVNSPQQPVDARLEGLIRKILVAPVLAQNMEQSNAA